MTKEEINIGASCSRQSIGANKCVAVDGWKCSFRAHGVQAEEGGMLFVWNADVCENGRPM